jgi:hypothetical protein
MIKVFLAVLRWGIQRCHQHLTVKLIENLLLKLFFYEKYGIKK